MEILFQILYRIATSYIKTALVVAHTMQKQQCVQRIKHQYYLTIGVTLGKQNNMKTLWRKLNEFTRKITSRRSSRGTKTTTVTSTYYSTADEFYIGVASEKSITVYLPAAAADGKIITVKAEMRPPLGSRKVHIATTDGSKIDGYSDASINVSHGYITLIRNNNEWYRIG